MNSFIREPKQVQGLLLVIASAVVFSTAGLFTKGVSADAWSVIFWRGLFAAIFSFAYLLLNASFRSEILGMGRPGIAAAIVSTAGTAAFIPAFKFTSIASVSLIYASAPFAAALIAWVWIKEKPSLLVMISSAIAFFGVAVIVTESISGLHLKGDLLALWMTLMMAGVMVIYRRFPKTPGTGPMALSSILLLPIAMMFGDPLSAPVNEIPIMASFGLIFAIASVTLVMGARHLPSPETALISSMEAPFAIFLAWTLLSEIPSSNTILGGVIILSAVLGSQVRYGRGKS